MPLRFVVPAAVVSILRDRLIMEVGEAASEISTVAACANREQHPEWFTEHLNQFDTTRGLLDLIGWKQPVHQAPVELAPGRDFTTTRDLLISELDLQRDLARASSELTSAQQRHRSLTKARDLEAFLVKIDPEEHF